MRIIGGICEEENNNRFSLIAPKFSYKYDYDSKKYKLYKLKKGIRICNVNVVNSGNFEYIEDFNSFREIDKKYLIEIFESEYNDWFINRLSFLYKRKNEKYRGFDINEQIVLKICISFPETFYKLYHGCNEGCKFKEGCEFIGIGGGNKMLIKDFYENVRCELYHFGSIKGNRYIDYEDNEKAYDVIYKKGEANCINLTEFIKKIKKSMSEYVSELKNNEILYNIFFENYVKDLNEYL